MRSGQLITISLRSGFKQCRGHHDELLSFYVHINTRFAAATMNRESRLLVTDEALIEFEKQPVKGQAVSKITINLEESMDDEKLGYELEHEQDPIT